MQKTKYYKRDWLVALVVGIVFAVAVGARSPLLERPELFAYDIGVKATHRLAGAADQIVIIAIDDPSIAEIGPWPWPRSVLAGMLERLARAKARTVGLWLDLTEPQVDPGLLALRDIRGELDAMAIPKQARAPFNALATLLGKAEKRLDTDRALARAMARTPRLHLPMFVEPGEPTGATESTAAEYLQRHRFARVIAAAEAPTRLPQEAPPQVRRIRPPLEQFARHARGIGHLSFRADPDNGARALHAALEHGGQYYPSLALLLAASSLNRDGRHLEFEVGKGIRLGKLFVPVDRAGRTYTGFYRPPDKAHAFPVYSFRDVHAGTVPPSHFTNKLVLVGLSASRIGPRFATPISGSALMPAPEVAAHAIASILNQDFYTRPDWTLGAEAALAAAVLLYLMLALGRMSGRTAALVTLLLLIGLLGAEQFLMVSEKVWLRAVSPAMLLLMGHLAITGKRLALGERALLEAQTDTAHSNRLLGLTFQAQGQLDMAMDKFRKLPVDESVLELIYNLALDFERKRQFHKAAAAYDYVLAHRPVFRDCAERKQRALRGDQTIVLGTLILDGAEKPTLGRYQVEKELGRGAMGIVYLGRDPKINRRVAIKTMALSREFEPGELAAARARFFREAETAGRLHHPNIVTIYDVGEEHDLAYIAMEYLEGRDLSTYIEPDKRLAFDWILDVAIKIADALGYAHENGVVHRDIKPTNIVYHEASAGVKVTDFGIARITDARRTKTGTVLGTPPYMSPEQISGERVDGRSDLFSFGSMLFELITGAIPFTGDSLAALMYQVTNAPAPDVRKRRPDTPAPLAAIVKRLLQKKAKKRYQTGAELKQDLEHCRGRLS